MKKTILMIASCIFFLGSCQQEELLLPEETTLETRSSGGVFRITITSGGSISLEWDDPWGQGNALPALYDITVRSSVYGTIYTKTVRGYTGYDLGSIPSRYSVSSLGTVYADIMVGGAGHVKTYILTYKSGNFSGGTAVQVCDHQFDMYHLSAFNSIYLDKNSKVIRLPQGISFSYQIVFTYEYINPINNERYGGQISKIVHPRQNEDYVPWINHPHSGTVGTVRVYTMDCRHVTASGTGNCTNYIEAPFSASDLGSSTSIGFTIPASFREVKASK